MHKVLAKGILSARNGMNIYRGCTHGCIYCDSRSDCYQIKHDFEDIEVKINAPQLLELALRRKRRPCMIGTGAMCDPYMHCEMELMLTRKCLEIIDKYSFGAAVQTKSDRILRDMDLFSSINQKAKAVAQMTITTAEDELCKIIEPDVCPTSKRYLALKEFQKNKIPTVVWLSPILPFINDTEQNIREIVELCADCGAVAIINFGIGLTLRDGDREYFYSALEKHFPGLKNRYIAAFGTSYECISPQNYKLYPLFTSLCEKYGIMYDVGRIFAYLNDFPEVKPDFEQLSLF